jgi:transcriptional regulator with XRE-family HTH domain
MAHNAKYAEVRARLRTIRKVKGWTLRDVEEYSHGDICAVVLGSWERGNRKPTLERLLFLCEDIYRVPLSTIVSGSHEDFILLRREQLVANYLPPLYIRGEK